MKYKDEFKFIFFFALIFSLFLLLTGCASSKWIKTGGTQVGDYYVDKTYTRKNNYGRVLTLEMVDFKAPMIDKSASYQSLHAFYEYDCSNETRKLRSMTAYTGKMGTGSSVNVPVGNRYNKWEPLHHGKMDEEIMVSVCYVPQEDIQQAQKREKFNELLLYNIYLNQIK